jgi:cell shape-determining protein MreC
LTSGIPAGLIIGQVIGVERDELRNEVQADVVPAVNFDTLQSVMVITGTQTE